MSSPPADPTQPARVQLGQQLRAARLAAGLTQEELAHRIDLDRPSVVRVEAGQVDSRLSTLIRVAGAVGLRVGFLSEPGQQD